MYFPWDYLSNCGGMLDTWRSNLATLLCCTYDMYSWLSQANGYIRFNSAGVPVISMFRNLSFDRGMISIMTAKTKIQHYRNSFKVQS
jgi:hypothetical protein